MIINKYTTLGFKFRIGGLSAKNKLQVSGHAPLSQFCSAIPESVAHSIGSVSEFPVSQLTAEFLQRSAEVLSMCAITSPSKEFQIK